MSNFALHLISILFCRYFESKKKKNKKEKTDDIRNFPGREEIKFGDIVEAPPKLNFPKVSFYHFHGFLFVF